MILLDWLPTELGAAAVLPALMLLWLVVATDRRPEPPGFVATAFLLGIAAIFVTRYTRAPFVPLLHFSDHPWASVIAHAAFVAAIPEETAKVALIGLLVLRLRAVHEPMDGVVYGAAVGLGFAAWENLGYLVHSALDWETLALMRDVVTVPFHGALGMIAGAYLGAARFAHALGSRRGERFYRARLILLAWLVPVSLHVAFDIPVLALHDSLADGAAQLALTAGSFAVACAAVVYALITARRIAAHQKLFPGARHLPVARWRGVWAIVSLGATAMLFGAALLASATHHAWRVSADADPVGLASGAALLVAGVAIFQWSRRHLMANARANRV